MAGDLPRRVKALATTFGVPTREDVIAALERDSEFVAGLIRDILQGFIDTINKRSISGSLVGYEALAEQLQANQRIILPKSGVDVSGKYSWAVYVIPSAHHAAKGLNIFDVLDAGRPALPARDPKTQGPYPLWNLGESMMRQSRVVASSGNAVDAARQEPRFAAGLNQDNPNLRFTYRALAGFDGFNLYNRALEIAKDRLTGTRRVWDIFYVGPRPNG